MRKRIIVDIEITNVGDETQTGADEALFDFGIGKGPEDIGHDGATWPNLSGMWYEVKSVQVIDPPAHGHDIARLPAMDLSWVAMHLERSRRNGKSVRIQTGSDSKGPWVKFDFGNGAGWTAPIRGEVI